MCVCVVRVFLERRHAAEKYIGKISALVRCIENWILDFCVRVAHADRRRMMKRGGRRAQFVFALGGVLVVLWVQS